jgi:cold-inducible RNA-binding protein
VGFLNCHSGDGECVKCNIYYVINAEYCTFTKKYSMTIFVAGLPYDLDDAELEEIFEKFGTVTSAKVSMDRETGKSRGFAFVTMPIAEEGKQAIELLNDISLGKKPLVVKEAEERSQPSSYKNRDQGGNNYGNGAPGRRRNF